MEKGEVEAGVMEIGGSGGWCDGERGKWRLL